MKTGRMWEMSEMVIKVLFVVTFLLACILPVLHLARADEVEIPFPIKLDSFKAEAKTLGLDFYDTDDSDGFIENRGQQIIIFTYRPITKQELSLIKDLIPKHLRVSNGKYDVR